MTRPAPLPNGSRSSSFMLPGSSAPLQGGDLRFLSQLKALRKSFEATCPQQ